MPWLCWESLFSMFCMLCMDKGSSLNLNVMISSNYVDVYICIHVCIYVYMSCLTGSSWIMIV